MLEAVGRVGRRAAAEDQLGGDQLVEAACQLRPRGTVGDRGEQLVGELAADRRADLGDLLDRGQPVEPRHQRVVQGRRNGERRQRARQLVVVAGVASAGPIPAPSWSAPRRTAARRRCAARICSRTSAGSALPPVTRSDHRRALAPAEAVQRSAPSRAPGPTRAAELRPVGDHDAGPAGRAPARSADRAAPASSGSIQCSVLEEHQHRPLAGEPGRAARSATSKVRCFCRCGLRFERG